MTRGMLRLLFISSLIIVAPHIMGEIFFEQERVSIDFSKKPEFQIFERSDFEILSIRVSKSSLAKSFVISKCERMVYLSVSSDGEFSEEYPKASVLNNLPFCTSLNDLSIRAPLWIELDTLDRDCPNLECLDLWGVKTLSLIHI